MKKTRSAWKRSLGTVVGEEHLDLAFWERTSGGIGGVCFNGVGRIADVRVSSIVGVSRVLFEKMRTVSLEKKTIK